MSTGHEISIYRQNAAATVSTGRLWYQHRPGLRCSILQLRARFHTVLVLSASVQGLHCCHEAGTYTPGACAAARATHAVQQRAEPQCPGTARPRRGVCSSRRSAGPLSTRSCALFGCLQAPSTARTYALQQAHRTMATTASLNYFPGSPRLE